MGVPPLLYPIYCLISATCESGFQAPYFYVEPKYTGIHYAGGINPHEPTVRTTTGLVQGYVMRTSEGLEVNAFTGIPYAEPPEMFKSPIPRQPWNGVLLANRESPYCIHKRPNAVGKVVRGQVDCLFLDVYSPRHPPPPHPDPPRTHNTRTNTTSSLLPIIIWLPAGGNVWARSSFYGPAVLLHERVILVVINIRLGIHGYMTTGDATSPGNYALKDMALSIEWVHANARAFGGDPNRIVLGGVSSSAITVHSILFSDLKFKNLVSGLIIQSGSMFTHASLDIRKAVRHRSNLVARMARCPTANGEEVRSRAMVACLRKIDPVRLTQMDILSLWTPVLEREDVPGAYITRLPETSYERGLVPPIPFIMSRGAREMQLSNKNIQSWPLYDIVSRGWPTYLPFTLRFAYRNSNITYNPDYMAAARQVKRMYLDHDPYINGERVGYENMVEDLGVNAPMWKAIEMHHKVAPTYAYVNRVNGFGSNKLIQRRVGDLDGTHAADVILLFNNTRSFPLFTGTKYESASKRLVSLMANFATYGIPYITTREGKLREVWIPVTRSNDPVALECKLNGVRMIRDPVYQRCMKLDDIPL